jgi:hypothetical protein
MPEPAYETRPLREDERDWLSEVLLERRGRALIVGRGRVRQVKDQLWNAGRSRRSWNRMPRNNDGLVPLTLRAYR